MGRLRAWDEKDTTNSGALDKIAVAVDRWLKVNNIAFKHVVYDIFDLGFNVVIENVIADLEDTAQYIEDNFIFKNRTFKTRVVGDSIYLDTTEEYEDRFGNICTRVFRG